MLTRDLDPVEDLRGAIRDGKVYGLGASNMKCGLAAFMVAGKALKDSGMPIKGDLILAGVAGEISRSPIGPYQSEDYRGEGAGTRHLLAHGVQSDYAICADGSAPVGGPRADRRGAVFKDHYLRHAALGLGQDAQSCTAEG